MRSLRLAWCLVTISLVAGPVFAQDVDLDSDREAFGVPEGNWNDDDNWVDLNGEISGAPSLDFGLWALVGNGGHVVVDDDSSAGGLRVTNGTIDIRQGGTLTIDETDFTSGITALSAPATLMLTGNGEFNGATLNNEGTIHLGAASVSASASGDFTHSGEIAVKRFVRLNTIHLRRRHRHTWWQCCSDLRRCFTRKWRHLPVCVRSGSHCRRRPRTDPSGRRPVGTRTQRGAIDVGWKRFHQDPERADPLGRSRLWKCQNHERDWRSTGTDWLFDFL